MDLNDFDDALLMYDELYDDAADYNSFYLPHTGGQESGEVDISESDSNGSTIDSEMINQIVTQHLSESNMFGGSFIVDRDYDESIETQEELIVDIGPEYKDDTESYVVDTSESYVVDKFYEPKTRTGGRHDQDINTFILESIKSINY
jgi:hypothetical protein